MKRSRIAAVALAALAAVGCEHPAASPRSSGPVPVPLLRAENGDGARALLADHSLRQLLLQSALDSTMEVPPAADIGARPEVPATGPWLRGQSALLRVLVERSRAAYSAVEQARGER